jgi:acetoin utilization deacetylase AcuC-like enzyme
MPIGLFIDDLCLQHDTGRGHPERASRLEAVTKELEAIGALKSAQRLPMRDVTEEDVLRVHTPAYYNLAVREIESGVDQLSTGDTVVCRESLAASRRAAGGVLSAVDAVVEGKIKRTFCAVRPPGHHATPSRGMGFCVFNSIAIGARYAQKKHGLGKVAIIDWDVHHGNGTQDVFYEDASVFFFSSHQAPWYPGTGREDETGHGAGLGSTMNRPLPSGTGIEKMRPVFTDHLLPALDRFQPELIMISAGFDSRVGDPLGQFTLEDEHFAELTQLLRACAERHAEGRLVSVLEGGYNLRGLASAAATHWQALEKESD